MTWIIMDENPLTINDGSMEISMEQILADYPGNYHNCAAGISFADGHTEMHRWVDAFAKNLSLTGATGGPGSTSYMAPIPCLDLAWLQPRTTALR